jgi:putative endonuclease
MNKRNLGNIGEEFALEYFKRNGFEIYERNYRTRFGEIDLIAKKRNLIIFVEVKTRKSLDFGEPIEAIDKRKQQKIKFLANFYLSKLKGSYQIRFDVFLIVLDKNNKILSWEHIPNAF